MRKNKIYTYYSFIKLNTDEKILIASNFLFAVK